MLNIQDLHVSIAEKPILNGINLQIQPGEVHAIMGPNGSGKSTLANVLAGNEEYQVTAGSISYQGVNLLELPAEERACMGIFMAFQYPVEIPGVSNINLLKYAVNARRRFNSLDELDAMDFLAQIREKMDQVEMPEEFLSRAVNQGFSGGEKKRNEILQMTMLEPQLAILDETDSGLDIDAMKIVASGVNSMRSPERSFILVTHYQRLLDYVIPDRVHVLSAGCIVRSGTQQLAMELEKHGYGWVTEQPPVDEPATGIQP